MSTEERILLEMQQINSNLFDLNKRLQDILRTLQPKHTKIEIEINENYLKCFNSLFAQKSQN